MSIEIWTQLLGWMTIVNSAIMLISVLLVWILRDFAVSMHSKIFDIPGDNIRVEMYRYLGTYKVAIIVLNLTPYLALRLFM